MENLSKIHGRAAGWGLFISQWQDSPRRLPGRSRLSSKGAVSSFFRAQPSYLVSTDCRPDKRALVRSVRDTVAHASTEADKAAASVGWVVHCRRVVCPRIIRHGTFP